MSTRLRRPVVALLATTLAAGVLGVAQPAHAADGTIGGTVTGPDGPVEGAQVTLYLYDAVDDEYYYGASASTDADGTYSLSVVPGSYRLAFEDLDRGDLVGEYYDDQLDVDLADSVTVPDGGSAPPADAELAPASHVTGKITGPFGLPLDGVSVSAHRATTIDGRVEYPQVSGAVTDALGRYDIGSLPAGTYRIRLGEEFSSPGYSTDHATEWRADKPSLESGTDLVVPPDSTVDNIDAQLAVDSEVSGRVTDANGAGVTRGEVSALREVGTEWHHVSTAELDTDGTYLLDGLQAGTYRVLFHAFPGADVELTEWWNDEGLPENASDVVVSPNTEVAGISAQLVPGEHDGEPPPVATPPVEPPPAGAPPGVSPPAVAPPVAPPALDVPTALVRALAALELSGKPRVGRALRVTRLDRGLGATYRFQWYAGASKIRKATRSRLAVTAAMKRQRVAVKVTGTVGSTSRSVRLTAGKVR